MTVRKYVLLMVFGMCTFFGNAQKLSEMNPQIEEAINEAKAHYQLDESQVLEMIIIENRKQRNLREISSLKSENPDIYYAKLKSIRVSTEASMEKMMRPAQIEILNKKRLAIRQSHASETNKLKEQGLSFEEIQKALLRLEEK